MKTCAVIPVKSFDNAKQRLSALLTDAERKALSYAMLEDVLIAIEACPLVDQCLLVTKDAAAIEMVQYNDRA